MANWSLPTLTDLYTNFRTYLMNRDSDAVRLNDSRTTAATNLPDYAKRWNDSSKTFQNWLSAAWGNLVLSIAGGGTGATTAADARTNLDVYSTAEADAAFSPPITSSRTLLGADVTMTTPSTWYDGPSVSLAAGTWLVIGAVTLYKSGTGFTNASVKLRDGAGTVHATADLNCDASALSYRSYFPFNVSTVITLGATTTLKVSCSSTAASVVISKDALGEKSSYILAVKLA